ncbi:MAG: rod shape-determining protein MreD [Arenimonas sp.]
MIRPPTNWLVWGSFGLGLLFAILPLPELVSAARPFLLAMLLAYWIMESPTKVGMGSAFLLGLVGDLLSASLLGEQALRLVVIAFLVQRFRARLRFFPLWQQAGAIGLLLLNDRVISALVHFVIGEPQAGWSSWLAWILGMVLWPWLYVLLDMARLRARERS